VIDLKVSGTSAASAPPPVANDNQRSNLVAQRSSFNSFTNFLSLKLRKSNKVGELRHFDRFGSADQRSEFCWPVWKQITHPRSEQEQADQMSLLSVGKTAESLVVQQIAGEPHLAVLLLKLSQVSEPEILIHMMAPDGSRVPGFAPRSERAKG
jgi:hypothetical protein